MPPKYIANGSSGCVLKPPIACKNNTNSTKQTENSITKIFDNTQIKDDEIYIQKIIEKIDPNNYFTIKLISDCDIDINSYPATELINCTNFIDTKKQFSQIIYEDGGLSIDDYIDDISLPAIELKFFERIFKGLTVLENYGILHLDIKPANIVYNSKIQKMSIIDFGALTKIDDLYSVNNQELHKYSYYFFPPEFHIYYYRKLQLSNYEEIISLYKIVKFCKLFKIYDYVYEQNYIYNLGNFYDKISSLNDFKDYKNTTGKTREYLDKYANKVDVYSLGITLLFYFAEKTPKYESNPILCKKIGELICNMINLNPEERYTSQEAYDSFMNIIKSRSTYKTIRKRSTMNIPSTKLHSLSMSKSNNKKDCIKKKKII